MGTQAQDRPNMNGYCKVQKMGLTHRLAATVIKFGELKNRIKDSYAVAVSLKQKAYM